MVKDLPPKDNSIARADAKRHIGAVTHSLVQFAKQSSERDITDDVATDCLIVFLSQFSIPCAYSDANRTPIRFEVGQRSDSKRTVFRLKSDSRPD